MRPRPSSPRPYPTRSSATLNRIAVAMAAGSLDLALARHGHVLDDVAIPRGATIAFGAARERA